MARKKLYFAYGMNMEQIMMHARCRTSEPVSKAILPDYRLVFNGVANVQPKQSSMVRGALYKIGPKDEAALDTLEGFPTLYEKKTVTVVDDTGKRVKAMMYIMNKKRRGRRVANPPTDFYYDMIAQGYEQWGHSDVPLKKARDRSERMATERRERNREDWGRNGNGQFLQGALGFGS